MNEILECLAVITSAIFGVMLARRHHMDFVGIFSMALIVAFGGGTLRDLFLGLHPLFWIRESHYPVIVFSIAMFMSLLKRLPDRLENYLMIPDALGLGLFTIVGAIAGLESGTSYFTASLLGVLTGTFGGVIGDVICNRVPSLFRSSPLFASCSFGGSWLFFLLEASPVANAYAASIAIATIVATRLLAIRFDLRFPSIGGDSIGGDDE